MRKCPYCGEQMEQDNPQDNNPNDIWECPHCGHAEENEEAEDFNPDEEQSL